MIDPSLGQVPSTTSSRSHDGFVGIREEPPPQSGAAPQPSPSPAAVPQESPVSAAYHALREQLVGTDLGNPLVNFDPRRNGHVISIGDERCDPVFELLVEQGESFTFGAARGAANGTSPLLLDQPKRGAGRRSEEAHHVDLLLQTVHGGPDLQTRLLGTSTEARLHQAERGAHSLYLALGMLHWRDTAEGRELRAPSFSFP